MVTVRLFREHNSAEQALERLRLDMPQIDRVLRLAFATQIVGHVQMNYLRGQVLKRQSGDLATSMAHRDTSLNETMIGSYGVIYARIHELGGEIRPKVKKMLRFQLGNGKWITTKLVRMPKRPYLLPGIQSYFQTGQAEDTAHKILQRELDKREN
jgi:phage gpG-like protein